MKIKRIKLCSLAVSIGLLFMISSCENENLTEPVNMESVKHDGRAIKSGLTARTNTENYDVGDDLLLITKIKGNQSNKAKIMFTDGFDKSELQRRGGPGQQVNIPDANFEQALIDLGVDDVLDGLVLKNNVKNITVLNVDRKAITDLSGIEHFKSLTYLNCNFNQLTSLNVTKNENLLELYCDGNLLTSLNISKNENLKVLECFDNQITSLDVSKNVPLTILRCSINPLKNLDVTKNVNLEELWASTTELTSLDVSNNVNLRLLACRNQPLASLDVTQNTKLESLFTGPFSLLESLDVSNNPVLIQLNAISNQLKSLNVKNGNNTNFINFQVNDNPDLDCIQVDDALYSETNWIFKDACAVFLEDCSSFIPPTICVTDLSGSHSYVSTNLQAETGTCPTDPVVGTVTFSKICGNSYFVSDLYFGMNDSSCWYDIPMPSQSVGFSISNNDCNLLTSGYLDIYGFNVTWTITAVIGPDLYISWENNIVDYGYFINDSGDVVITREGGADWPPLYNN